AGSHSTVIVLTPRRACGWPTCFRVGLGYGHSDTRQLTKGSEYHHGQRHRCEEEREEGAADDVEGEARSEARRRRRIVPQGAEGLSTPPRPIAGAFAWQRRNPRLCHAARAR